MYIHPVVLVVMVLLYLYLIVTDIRLHRRIEKLEKTVRRLDGLNGEDGTRPCQEEFS